jgi:hypothetical protein
VEDHLPRFDLQRTLLKLLQNHWQDRQMHQSEIERQATIHESRKCRWRCLCLPGVFEEGLQGKKFGLLDTDSIYLNKESAVHQVHYSQLIKAMLGRVWVYGIILTVLLDGM